MAGSRPIRCGLAALALTLALAPAAHADAFDRIFHEYQKTGKIDPCHFSRQDLEKAQGQVPNDIEAYAPDFPEALQAAAEQRAGGACARKQATAAAPAAAAPAATPPAAPAAPGATAAPAAGATGTPAPTPDAQPAASIADDAIAKAADTRRASDAGPPAPVVALAVVGLLLALGGLGYGLARWLAWEPRWATGTRHAVGEAGWRASATWAEFTDWLRLGR
jgi:hypothetical protein